MTKLTLPSANTNAPLVPLATEDKAGAPQAPQAHISSRRSRDTAADSPLSPISPRRSRSSEVNITARQVRSPSGQRTAQANVPGSDEAGTSQNLEPLRQLVRRRHRGDITPNTAPPIETPPVNEPTTFVGRAANFAYKAVVGACMAYTGALAIAAGHRALRNPGDLFRHPIATGVGIVGFSHRVYEGVPIQAQTDVQQMYGRHIPPDSVCYGIEPEISFDLPPGVSGRVIRSTQQNNKLEPVKMKLAAYPTLNSGLHAAHHEYLHCFTHVNFARAIEKNPHAHSIEEAITEYFADKFPGNPINKFSPYDLNKLSNGKKWSAAAAELEKNVGKDVLEKAYFGGDRTAIRKVCAAIVDIWPKKPSSAAWQNIRYGEKQQRQALAECFLGAMLIHTGKLPDNPRPGSGQGIWAFDNLPVSTFTAIGPEQAAQMRLQAEQTRTRIGAPLFDQAFCNSEPQGQSEAMKQIRNEVHKNWRTVLSS